MCLASMICSLKFRSIPPVYAMFPDDTDGFLLIDNGDRLRSLDTFITLIWIPVGCPSVGYWRDAGITRYHHTRDILADPILPAHHQTAQLMYISIGCRRQPLHRRTV